MFKRSIILLTFSFLTFTVGAQISGISGSKMTSICTATVPNKTIEFEPSFEMNRIYGFYEDFGLSYPFADSVYYSSGTGLRFSYGVLENLELGVSLPIDASEFGFGAKYQFPFGENSKFALLAGYDFEIDNSWRSKTIGKNAIKRFGVAFSQNLGEKLSADANFIYSKNSFTGTILSQTWYFASADVGYYVTDGMQFVVSADYLSEDILIRFNNLLSLTPGITVERAENFILVLGMPFTVWGTGMNTKNIGFATALTIMID